MTNQEPIQDMNSTLMPNTMINVSSTNRVNRADRRLGILTRVLLHDMHPPPHLYIEGKGKKSGWRFSLFQLTASHERRRTLVVP